MCFQSIITFIYYKLFKYKGDKQDGHYNDYDRHNHSELITFLNNNKIINPPFTNSKGILYEKVPLFECDNQSFDLNEIDNYSDDEKDNHSDNEIDNHSDNEIDNNSDDFQDSYDTIK